MNVCMYVFICVDIFNVTNALESHSNNRISKAKQTNNDINNNLDR